MKNIFKKNLLAVFVAAVIVFGLAGQSMAAFAENFGLIRVIYRTDGPVEVATDLGNVTSLITQTNANVGGGSEAFNLSMFGTGASWDNLRVAYLSKSFADKDAWVSATSSTLTSGSRKFTNYNSGLVNMVSYYNYLGSGTVVGDKMNPSSYWYKMDGNSTIVGQFAGLIPLGGVKGTEMSLAAFSTLGYVDQYLYYFNSADTVQNGVQVATIRTWADGHTTINYNPVPVPPGIFLLGGGLLGLVGLRKRIGSKAEA